MKTRTLVRVVFAALAFTLTMSTALAEEPAAVKEWTVLVFLNADNNLDPFGPKDMGEMEKVGSTDALNVVVQMDREREGAKRYFVKNGSSDVLEDMGEIDMGSHQVLVDFVKWGVARYPAKRYFVVLWNHGSGWMKKGEPAKGVCYDDQSGNHITTPQLGQALAAIHAHLGRKLDLLGFDACLMAMAEVAYEVKDHAVAMVGSEETEPGDGWPYTAWLKPLAAKPGMGALELGGIVAKEFTGSYWLSKSTQSCLDLAQMVALREKLDLWASAVKADTTGQATTALDAALGTVARFAYAEYCDLFDLLRLFQDGVKDAGLRSATEAALALKGRVVSTNSAHAFPFSPKNIFGLSVHFPRSGGWLGSYRQLSWAKDGQWDELLEHHLGKATEGATAFDALWREHE